MSVNLPVPVAKACLIIAKDADKARVSLRAVRIDNGRAIATDGHRMIVVRFTTETTPTFSVGVEPLELALKAAGRTAYNVPVSAGHVGPIPNVDQGEYAYPNWPAVVNDTLAAEPADDAETTFQWDYLDSITAAFRELEGQSTRRRYSDTAYHARFTRRGKKAATAMHSGSYDALALVMPRLCDPKTDRETYDKVRKALALA